MRIKASSILSRVKRTLFIPFVFFSLAVILIFVILYRNDAINKYYEQCDYEDTILAQTFSVEIDNVKNCTNMIIIHLNELLDSSYLDDDLYPVPAGRTQSIISKCMMDAFTTFSNLNQIVIVWNNGVMFYENWTKNYFLSSNGEELIEQLQSMDITRFGKWMPSFDNNQLLTGDGPIYAKAYIDIATGKQTGYVILKASPIFEMVGRGKDAKHLLLYSPEGALIKSLGSEALLAEQGPVYSHNIRLDNHWTLLSTTDLSAELSDLDRMILEIIILNFLLLLLVYLLTNHLMSRIVRPVRELSDHIANGKDTLPQPISLTVKNDEVGVLVNRFNEMSRHNQDLVHMLLEERKREEHLKFSLLQAQIKPHFLYNTLDTIYCLSTLGKNDDASRMIKLLSEYYRHVLSNGFDWVLLSEEVRQTKDYLDIQSIRYHHSLEYQIIWENAVDEVRIPKLTLQPIVENAIYHGIKPTGQKGHLTISLRQKDATIEIRVIDDGQGMTNETLTHIIKEAREDDSGFGLHNVYERLRLYYADSFSMSIEPHPQQKGTCFLICLPVMEEEL